MSQLIDMTGRKIGKLTVLGYAGSKFRGRSAKATCHCVCDCGARLIVVGAHLREGHTKSCGCATRFTPGRARLIRRRVKNQGRARGGGASKSRKRPGCQSAERPSGRLLIEPTREKRGKRSA